jgi:hypothetical protein
VAWLFLNAPKLSSSDLFDSIKIEEKVMKTLGLVSTICTMAIGLTFQSAAWGYTVDASSFYIYRTGPNGFTSQSDGTATAANNIIPGASGVGSSVLALYGPTNGLSLSVSALAVQDYGIFHGLASSQLARDYTPGSFEVLQVFATGKFVETLTIGGGTLGTAGKLMLGWDVTGSSSNGSSGDAHLIINARTSASLPNTNSQTTGITSNGQYFLFSPISFTFGTAFDLTVDSSVFAAVGYDNTSNAGSDTFSDSASADFLHTAILSSVGVSDSAGNTLANFTITTGSGRAFPVVASIPEPESYAMLLAGLGLLGVFARFKKQPA